MQISPNVNLAELQQYIDDEREKEAKAARDARRAEIDRLLEELEERRTADAKADAEREARECPSARTAQFLFDALGERWPEFVNMFRASTFNKLVPAVNRLEAERENVLRRQNVDGASTAREDARQAAVAARKTNIERELAVAGVMLDVSDDD